MERINSLADQYIHNLVKLDGMKRMEALKITKKHYQKKTIAVKWRNEIAKAIHPDICKNEAAEQAMAKLNELFSSMMENAK